MPLNWGGRSRGGGTLSLLGVQSNTGQQGHVSALLSFADTLLGASKPGKRNQRTGRSLPTGRSGQYFHVEDRAMSHSARLAALPKTIVPKSEEFGFSGSRNKAFQVVPSSLLSSRDWDGLDNDRDAEINSNQRMDFPLPTSSGRIDGPLPASPSGSMPNQKTKRPKVQQLDMPASRSNSKNRTEQQLELPASRSNSKNSPERPLSNLEMWRQEAMQSFGSEHRRGSKNRSETHREQGNQEGDDAIDDSCEHGEEPRTMCSLARSCLKTHQPRRQAGAHSVHLQLVQSGTHSGKRQGSVMEDSNLLLLGSMSTTPDTSTTPKGKARPSRGAWYKSLGTFDIVQLAEAFNLPIDQMKRARQIFSKYDTDGNGELDKEEFQLLLRSMLREMYPKAKDVPRYLFNRVDVSQDGKVDFYEFLEWYSMNSFNEGLLLSPEQQRMRAIARKWGIAITEVEKAKHEFDKYDKDSSGRIDLSEFRALLGILLKVPKHVELPENRVESFWKEIDTDGSGEVDFEEFLSWYRKYFDMTSDNYSRTSTIEQFYGSVRGVSHRSGLDPVEEDFHFH